jgi:hypothetical protein
MMGIDVADLVKRLVKYALEGLAVGIACWIIDTDYSDGRTYLSEKIKLHYQPLGAAEIPIAVREPDEPYLVAVLRSPTAPGNGPAALAVQLAVRLPSRPQTSHRPHCCHTLLWSRYAAPILPRTVPNPRFPSVLGHTGTRIHCGSLGCCGTLPT